MRKINLSAEIKATITIVTVILLITIMNPLFLSLYNLGNLIDGLNTIFTLAIGLTFVLMSGCIDLSVGSMLSLSSVIFVLLLNSVGVLAFPLIIIIGFLQGLLVGLIFVGLQVPSFIASFGMMGVYQSLAILLSNGQTVPIELAKLDIADFINLEILGPIKIIHIFSVLLILFFYFIQKRTGFGRKVLAVGNGETTAHYSGLDVKRVKIMAFGLSGLSAALCSIVLTSRLYTGDPTYGVSYLLIVIAAVVVGGTALTGGIGGVLNTLLGAILIASLQNGMHILGIDVYYQQIVIGIILIIAVSITIDRERLSFVK